MKPFQSRCCAVALVFGLLWLADAIAMTKAVAAGVHSSQGTIVLPTYPWRPAVPHPYFRETDGKSIYPYPMFDNLSREKTEREYRTVVLENDYLRITFLPEIGGKIHEVVDKTTGEQMFYVNHVIKPGLIGMCGAWTSGGVEWNTGPQGHTVSAMQPVDVLILPPEKDGSQSVAIGEEERIYGTKWTVVVTLRPDRAFIEERIRIYNPTAFVRPYYFWNCTAAPNTPGFRFIYPMTLGCDHGSEKFFNWPIDHGKDLTRGTNYQDASSIFAWHCDQDFFGSYDDNADRGVVSFANHHQVPGKKAWTWGQGGFGKMHQMDLTDTDGPYNEVQTGPLLTQGEVGRLDPCETVEWREWWYPVHGIGGFTYANRDIAVNASPERGHIRLRILGTTDWSKAAVTLRGSGGAVSSRAECALGPRKAAELVLDMPKAANDEPLQVDITVDGATLAHFSVPLQLPVRTRPERKPKPETAAELAQSGWDHFLFGRMKEAEAAFRSAIGKDDKSVTARTGLAMLLVEKDSGSARKEAATALATDPDCGLARFVWATATLAEEEPAALDAAWMASLNPATAVASRALAARIYLGRRQYREAIAALSDPGPWQNDPLCLGRRAFAHLMVGDGDQAVQLAQASLELDPLDAFASSIIWLAGSGADGQRLAALAASNPIANVQLATAFWELKHPATALRLMDAFYLNRVPSSSREPIAAWWADFLRLRARESGGLPREHQVLPAPSPASDPVFPHGLATLEVLRDAVARDSTDGLAFLYLGHNLFQLRRFAEARGAWRQAAELAAAPAIAYRALGMASLSLDDGAARAAEYLSKAHAADPADAIVARDLALVLVAQADKADNADRKNHLLTQSKETLKAAFVSGKGRSDYVCLLGRIQNRLGEYSETARMLDSVRITVWEGSREAHDLFEEAHLALGRALAQAGQHAAALAQFDRALEYPDNLATGKLENSREGHIQRLRAEALSALGREDEARRAREKQD